MQIFGTVRHVKKKKKKDTIFKISFSYVYLAVERARMIARQADIIAAMSLEVLKGTTRAFDACKYDSGMIYRVNTTNIL